MGESPRQLKVEQLRPDLIGSLVLFNTPMRSEYGLVQSYKADEAIVYVRFHLGDTAAACNVEDLLLFVPAVRNQDREDIVAAVVAARRAAWGDSNDTEIQLLQDAIDLMVTALRLEIPEVDDPAET